MKFLYTKKFMWPSLIMLLLVSQPTSSSDNFIMDAEQEFEHFFMHEAKNFAHVVDKLVEVFKRCKEEIIRKKQTSDRELEQFVIALKCVQYETDSGRVINQIRSYTHLLSKNAQNYAFLKRLKSLIYRNKNK